MLSHNKMPDFAYISHYNALDELLKPYEWNWNLPRFVNEFFGQDRAWVFGALKAVLPAGRLTDEEIREVAHSLWGYGQHHTLNLEAALFQARNLEISLTQTLDEVIEDPSSD